MIQINVQNADCGFAEASMPIGCRSPQRRVEELMTLSAKIKYASIAAGLLAGAVLGAVSATFSAAHAQNAAQSAGISEDARTALARMNETLKASQFSFQAHTVRAYVGPNGELLHVVHMLKTIIRRPDRLLVDVKGDDGSSKVTYDGKSLVVYGADQNQYARLPVPDTIDQMLEVAEDRFKVDFPLADLLSGNPEKSLLTGVTSGGQVGTAIIDGVKCRHYFFIQSPDLNLEVWLEDNERSLPRRIFVTYRSLPGHPTFLAELSDWAFSIHPSDADFVFQPPAGAKQVELKARAADATTLTK